MTERASLPLVIGIGNPHRGDDAAGRAVVRVLRETLSAETRLTEQSGEATDLLAALDGVEAAYLVDACSSGAVPGTVHRFAVHAAPLPQDLAGPSTHGFGVAAALELGRALGQLPPVCIVYAIEGESFDHGAPLSPPVVAAVVDVARRVRAEIAGLADPREDADA